MANPEVLRSLGCLRIAPAPAAAVVERLQIRTAARRAAGLAPGWLTGVPR